MTWSIVAREEKTGAFAVAVTTCAFAVGARCPGGMGRIGALSSQALSNPIYQIDGVRLLMEGATAAEIVTSLTTADPGRDSRQFHVIDRNGMTAQWTGAECVPWCGSVTADGVSVAGNMLTGPNVVEATLAAYLSGKKLPLEERLLNALDAGQAAGGDKRGKQSAALIVWRDRPYAAFDIRVDDHPEPLVELRRLHGVANQRYTAFQTALPTRGNPRGTTDRGELEAIINAHIAQQAMKK